MYGFIIINSIEYIVVSMDGGVKGISRRSMHYG